MKYIGIGFLLMISVYPFSYVKYVWSKKNYIGAVGMIFLTLASIVFPGYLLFAR